MDTNLVAVLSALAAQRAPVQNNSVLIVGMILTALAPTLAMIPVWLKARSAERNSLKAVENTEENKVETGKLKEHINSRMDELQVQTKKASFAEGAASTIPDAPVPVTVQAVAPTAVTPEVLAQIMAALNAAETTPGIKALKPTPK